MHRMARALSRLTLALGLVAGACGGPRLSLSPPPPAATPTPAASPGQSLDRPTPDTTPSAPPTDAPPLELASIAVSLEPFATVRGGPLAVAAPDDGTGRLFVAVQDGQIWVVGQDGSVAAEPLVNLGPRLRSGGERGLLGVATHPAFPTDPRVFVHYTDDRGDTLVASLTLRPGEADRLAPKSHREILAVDQPFSNHNGGAVLFGPDGMLYVSLGDGGSSGDPQGNGQSLRTLLGKILRLDVDANPAAGPYATPPDNPFMDGEGLPEIWHFGLRNPWRVSFDRATGDLWLGDVGQGSWEEVDVARQGTSGLNFGWNRMEGSHCFRTERCSTEGLTLPVSDYGRGLGCTVIGGYVYRGARYPFLVGAYLFADYCTGRIFAIDAASDELTAPVVVGRVANGLSAFGEGADGELYVTNLGGEVSRLVATQR